MSEELTYATANLQEFITHCGKVGLKPTLSMREGGGLELQFGSSTLESDRRDIYKAVADIRHKLTSDFDFIWEACQTKRASPLCPKESSPPLLVKRAPPTRTPVDKRMLTSILLQYSEPILALLRYADHDYKLMQPVIYDFLKDSIPPHYLRCHDEWFSWAAKGHEKILPSSLFTDDGLVPVKMVGTSTCVLHRVIPYLVENWATPSSFYNMNIECSLTDSCGECDSLDIYVVPYVLDRSVFVRVCDDIFGISAKERNIHAYQLYYDGEVEMIRATGFAGHGKPGRSFTSDQITVKKLDGETKLLHDIRLKLAQYYVGGVTIMSNHFDISGANSESSAHCHVDIPEPLSLSQSDGLVHVSVSGSGYITSAAAFIKLKNGKYHRIADGTDIYFRVTGEGDSRIVWVKKCETRIGTWRLAGGNLYRGTMCRLVSHFSGILGREIVRSLRSMAMPETPELQFLSDAYEMQAAYKTVRWTNLLGTRNGTVEACDSESLERQLALVSPYSFYTTVCDGVVWDRDWEKVHESSTICLIKKE